MPKIKLLIAYDGTAFAGWQVQPGARTVQGELERCLEQLLGEKLFVAGSGRTDSGVHATGQVAHFETARCRVPPHKIPVALRGMLPPDLMVIGAMEVPENFHARFSAVRRVYRYRFRTGILYPHERNAFALFPYPFECARMEALLPVITGEHDFTTFSLKDSAGESRVRNIYHTAVEAQPGGFDLVLEGSGFLRRMVRMLTGSLLQVYPDPDAQQKLQQMLDARDNALSGPPAPASGLYLERVDYPPEFC